MTLGKNFRLPTDVKPKTYDADLRLDLNGDRFEGELAIELTLGAARRAITVHAVGLEVTDADRRGRRRATIAATRDRRRRERDRHADVRRASCRPATRACASPTGAPSARGCAASTARAASPSRSSRRPTRAGCSPASTSRRSRRSGGCASAGVPNQAIAISNGASSRDENDGHGGRRADVRADAAAVVVPGRADRRPAGGERRSTVARDVPIRTWTTPEKRQLTAFAQDIAAAVLPRLEDYFGLPYPFGKLDQIGVPDFEAGAMENAGAVTFREVALLADPATAPLAVQKRVAEVITHELAHQWFGNLVTMVWWDDLWLNEAFATWMAYKIVDDWRPVVAHLDGLRGGQGRGAGAGRAGVGAPDPRRRRTTPRRRASRSTPSPTRRAAPCCACSRASWARIASATASGSTCAATARRTRPPTICGARWARRRASRSSRWRTAGSGRPGYPLVDVALRRRRRRAPSS